MIRIFHILLFSPHQFGENKNCKSTTHEIWKKFSIMIIIEKSLEWEKILVILVSFITFFNKIKEKM